MNLFRVFLLSGLAAAGLFYTSTIFFKLPEPFSVIEKDRTDLPSLVSFPLAKPLTAHGWKEHSFHDKTRFDVRADASGSAAAVVDGSGAVVVDGKETFVQATSLKSSSALYRGVKLPVSGHPHLSWEWNVTRFPSNKQNKVFASKQDNDFGARVYVVFGSRTPLASEVIQYVWDDHFPEGTSTESPYSKKVKMLVIQNGPLKSGSKAVDGKWVAEDRDLEKDYEMLFGRKLKRPLTAVGFTSDSDNTKTDSEAYFRRFAVKMPEA